MSLRATIPLSMSVKIFNTQSKALEAVMPHDGQKVRFYSCGPTVYDSAHIGNLRSFITADLLARTIEMDGTAVEWVMNITDVDDKTIASTVREYADAADTDKLRIYTKKFTDAFIDDLHKVGIEVQNIEFVNVSDVIPEIQKYILRLMELGFAYKADDGSTYFSIEAYQEKFGDYGSLVGEKFLQGMVAGARVAVDEYEKESLADFALWKAQAANDGNIFWDHPVLGKGRPGWHIECTLINYMKFPSGTDVHSGGIDLVFPHHTNEIAQAKPVYGGVHFVGSWIHSEHIQVEGRKMSKSLRNTYTLNDFKANWGTGQSLRFLMLQSHYRSKLNVTEESIIAATVGLRNIHRQTSILTSQLGPGFAADVSIRNEYTARLMQAMSEDLDSPTAIALLFEVLKSSLASAEKLSTVSVFELVLGLQLVGTPQSAQEIPEEIQLLVMKRDAARTSKDYTASDAYREELEKLGYEVSDTASGTIVSKK